MMGLPAARSSPSSSWFRGPSSRPKKAPGDSPIRLSSSSEPGVAMLEFVVRKMLLGGGVFGKLEILLL